MLYAIVIPAQFTAAVAAGEVALMTTTAGATTTLMASGGAIVGTATLVPAGGAAGASVAAGAGGIGVGTVLAATGIGLAILGVIGFGCWVLAEDQKRKDREAAVQASEMTIMVEGTEDDARAVLAQVQAIVDQAHGDLVDRELLVITSSSED